MTTSALYLGSDFYVKATWVEKKKLKNKNGCWVISFKILCLGGPEAHAISQYSGLAYPLLEPPILEMAWSSEGRMGIV